ncbi:MAG: hypothetical protein EAZ27_01150 [Cytophagales bacterium]|nr:MAG: hypothetical protein EAZ27_01150 [Cytophagales bacterium]
MGLYIIILFRPLLKFPFMRFGKIVVKS